MVPKAEQERLKILVRETLTLLCKNGLPYKSQFSLEALVGITLDKKDVLLVSINENIIGNNKTKPYPVALTKVHSVQHGGKLLRGGLSQPYKRGVRRARVLPSDDEMPDSVENTPGTRSEKPGADQDVDMIENVKTENDADVGGSRVSDNSEDSSDESDDGSALDMSTSDSCSDGEENPSAASRIVLEQMRSDIGSRGASAPPVDPRELQLRAMETGLLMEYQQAAFGKKRKHRKSEGDKLRSGEPKLNPMGADESAQIWAKAMANARDQKEPSPKKKSPKKRQSGDASKDKEEGAEQSGDGGEEKSEAPPMCHICGKSMSTEKNLTKHVRRHLGMFSVYCDECGKGFFDKTDLDAHAAKHANRKLYQCHVCGRSYSHNRGLLKHIRKDHKGALVGENVPPGMLPSRDVQENLQLQQAMNSIQNPAANHSQTVPQTEASNSAPTYSPQPAQQQGPLMAQESDSQMSHPMTSMPPQVASPLTQPLTQQITHPGHPGMIQHTAHLTHLRPELTFPPGLHPMGEAAYYYPYPSQSVFPGGPTH